MTFGPNGIMVHKWKVYAGSLFADSTKSKLIIVDKDREVIIVLRDDRTWDTNRRPSSKI